MSAKVSIITFFICISLSFSQESLNPFGVYQVTHSKPDFLYGETLEDVKNCPLFVNKLIKVFKEGALIDNYRLPFKVWNKGDEHYWSLGEIRTGPHFFHYQTRGMLGLELYRNFYLLKGIRNQYQLNLKIYIPYPKPDQYGTLGEVCRYTLLLHKL